MDLINVKEAAEILGIKHSTLNGWIFRNSVPFPFYRVNTRCIRFKKQDVVNYLEGVKHNGKK